MTAESGHSRAGHLDADAVGLVAVDAADLVYLANDAGASLLGFERDELLGRPLADLVVIADPAPPTLTSLIRLVRLGRPWAGALSVSGRDGRPPARLEATMTLLAGRGAPDAVGVVLVDSSMADLGLAGWLALHDPLTGLANRALLQDRFGQAAAHAKRHRTLVAVLFLDIDGFKAVNDTLGHAAGDLVLQHMAQRVRELLRPTDTLARFGGDEMVAVCEVPTVEALRDISERLASHAVVEVEPGWELQMSVGAAMATSAELDDLVRRADQAMYRAKHSGQPELDLAVD